MNCVGSESNSLHVSTISDDLPGLFDSIHWIMVAAAFNFDNADHTTRSVYELFSFEFGWRCLGLFGIHVCVDRECGRTQGVDDWH